MVSMSILHSCSQSIFLIGSLGVACLAIDVPWVCLMVVKSKDLLLKL